MTFKKSSLICAIALSVFPLFSYADIDVRNNTKGFGTAKTNLSPCSSTAGDAGIINPDSNLTIPQFVLNLYCAFGCNVEVYMTKNCSGKSIATLTVNPNKGITKINNHNEVGYFVLGNGKAASINGGPVKNIFDFIF